MRYIYGSARLRTEDSAADAAAMRRYADAVRERLCMVGWKPSAVLEKIDGGYASVYYALAMGGENELPENDEELDDFIGM